MIGKRLAAVALFAPVLMLATLGCSGISIQRAYSEQQEQAFRQALKAHPESIVDGFFDSWAQEEGWPRIYEAGSAVCEQISKDGIVETQALIADSLATRFGPEIKKDPTLAEVPEVLMRAYLSSVATTLVEAAIAPGSLCP